MTDLEDSTLENALKIVASPKIENGID